MFIKKKEHLNSLTCTNVIVAKPLFKNFALASINGLRGSTFMILTTVIFLIFSFDRLCDILEGSNIIKNDNYF